MSEEETSGGVLVNGNCVDTKKLKILNIKGPTPGVKFYGPKKINLLRTLELLYPTLGDDLQVSFPAAH